MTDVVKEYIFIMRQRNDSIHSTLSKYSLRLRCCHLVNPHIHVLALKSHNTCANLEVPLLKGVNSGEEIIRGRQTLFNSHVFCGRRKENEHLALNLECHKDNKNIIT